MKKITTLFFGIVMLGSTLFAQADSITSLIFTEWYGPNPYSCYWEITNVGDEELDLSNFTVAIVMGWLDGRINWNTDDGIPELYYSDPTEQIRLSGTLPPGKSLLSNNVWDSPGGDEIGNDDWERWTWNSSAFLNHPYYVPIQFDEPGEAEFWDRPDLQMFGFDSIAEHRYVNWLWNGIGTTLLFYHYPDGDSVLVDQVRLGKDPNSGKPDPSPSTVAGVPDASNTHILVRKASVTSGNPFWDVARGVDLSDSEWLPIPAYNPGRYSRQRPYTTVGSHGDFSISLTPSAGVTVDEENAKITVPFGTLKGDSSLNVLNPGPGMAWLYTEDESSFEDSAFATVQSGDVIQFMACGNDLEIKDYTLEVSAPAADMVMVYPKRRMRFEAIESEDFDGLVWGGEPYKVTQNVPGMDSITKIPFATRVDTLIKYIEMAPNASYEMDFIDDMERVDLKDGDILIVTAEDGSTQKQYYLSVEGYEPSDIAFLDAITWPDIPYFLDGWAGDTIPNFSSTSTSYQVLLPYGTMKVPAMTALLQDFNATVKVNRASNLSGSQADRTTEFVVTAEDGSTSETYSVLFTVEQRPEDIQFYEAEPFLSEIANGKRGYYEFVNVGDLPLDLSKYLFVWDNAGATPADAIQRIGAATAVSDFTKRYQHGYVPGYKFSDDTLQWQANPSKIYFDAAVDPVIDPGDVFVLGNPIKTKWVKQKAIDQCDVITSFGRDWISKLGVNFNTWGMENLIQATQMNMAFQQLFLFKIDNDTIYAGDKDLNVDPSDYTLVDMVGYPAGWADQIIGTHQRGSWNDQTSYRRKAHIYEGTTEATAESMVADWESDRKSDPGFTGDFVDWIGSHTFNPVTVHFSTVASNSFIVSVGYASPQTIQGDLASTTVADFYGYVAKADTGQDLSVISGTSGEMLGDADALAGGDTLIVVSADGKNTTKYVLDNTPLSDNVTITLTEGVTNLTISLDGESGTIEGVNYGDVLSEVLESLVMPDFATVSIINGEGELIPMKQLNYDTVLVNSIVGADVHIEVIAQNGSDMALYDFKPSSASSDAFVVSSLYAVDNVNAVIADLAGGTSVQLFWDNIEVVENANATLLDKAGFERTSGNMYFDDKLTVTSEDGTVTMVYYLTFITEVNPDGNLAPEVTLASSAITITDELTTEVSATASDDDVPFGSVLSYAWTVVEGDVADVTFADASAATTDVTFADTGVYELQVMVSDGEKSTAATVIVTVESSVGFELDGIGMRIYPNPANDLVNIEFDNVVGGKTEIAILDMTGKRVYLAELYDASTLIDVSKFEIGLYFITLKKGKEVRTLKLSINR